MVLQPADLPSAFVWFDYGPIARFDLTSGPRERLDRFGRKSGWKARYRRSGSLQTRGPLVVGSTVDLFGSVRGAEQDLDAYRLELERQGRLVDAPRVGDDAVAMRRSQHSGAAVVIFLTIAWRQDRVTASVSVNGFKGKLDIADAVALARSQERRIKAAAST